MPAMRFGFVLALSGCLVGTLALRPTEAPTTTTTSTTTPSPCQAYTAISLEHLIANNLGNRGPKDTDAAEMRFTRVATVADDDGVGQDFVDVVVTAVGGTGMGYDSPHTDKNGVDNGLATINVDGGRGVLLKFTFRRTESDAIVKVPRFFFTLLDLYKAPRAFETIEIFQSQFPYETFFTAPDTGVMTKKEVGKLTLRGSREDGFAGNPTDPANLSADQRKDAVTFWVAEPTAFFEIKYSTTLEEDHARNIMFAFQPTAIGCPAADNVPGL